MNTGVVVVAGVAVAVVVGGVVYMLRSRPAGEGGRDAALPPPPVQVAPAPMAGYSGGGAGGGGGSAQAPRPQSAAPAPAGAPDSFMDVFEDVTAGVNSVVNTVNGVVSTFNSIGQFFAGLNVGA